MRINAQRQPRATGLDVSLHHSLQLPAKRLLMPKPACTIASRL
jgi:hypothetical protein